ncbi:hypothetical protein GCM10027059_03750 [Myceligenerans halotolerans]
MTTRLPAPPTVLVARAPERAAGLIDRLRTAGIEAVTVPVIERAPVEDPAERAELARARAALARGDYTWVAVTSVNAVDALLSSPSGGQDTPIPGTESTAGTVPSGTALPRGLPNAPEGVHRAPSAAVAAVTAASRWACVGPATRRAVEANGLVVDLMPSGRMTAAALVDAFPDAPPGERGGVPGVLSERRVLVPLGDLAAPTLPDGLRAKGWEPHVVTAYRTVARELPRDVVEHAKGAGYDAVVVASGSAARQLAEQIGSQRIVAIGEPSASAARDAGHEVVAVAAAPSDDALATAVVQALDLSA